MTALNLTQERSDFLAAFPEPLAGYGMASPAKLVVGVQINESDVTIAVHLKQGDMTTVLYTQNHPVDRDTIGFSILPVDLTGVPA